LPSPSCETSPPIRCCLPASIPGLRKVVAWPSLLPAPHLHLSSPLVSSAINCNGRCPLADLESSDRQGWQTPNCHADWELCSRSQSPMNPHRRDYHGCKGPAGINFQGIAVAGMPRKSRPAALGLISTGARLGLPPSSVVETRIGEDYGRFGKLSGAKGLDRRRLRCLLGAGPPNEVQLPYSVIRERAEPIPIIP
jgi:hypothetical protein